MFPCFAREPKIQPIKSLPWFLKGGDFLEPVTGLAAVIEAITTVVSGVISWIAAYMGAITSAGNELLLVFFALPLVGLGIGAIKRLIG